MKKNKKLSKTQIEINDAMEKVVLSIVKEVGVQSLAVILNNVFVHGEILTEMYGSCTQEDLDLIYEGIAKFREVGERLG